MRARRQGRAARQPHLGEAARLRGRDQFDGGLQVHDVDVIFLDVLLQRGGHFRAFRVLDRDEILDRHRVQHLAAEALGDDAGVDALARRIDRRRRAGRAAADDQHVEGRLVLELCGGAHRGARVDLGQHLLEPQPALGEQFAVQEHGGHGHDLARLDLVLEQGAVDGDVVDASG